jgi:hypothetical protein
MGYILDAAISKVTKGDASKDEKNVNQTKVDDYSLVQSRMLYAMEYDLQKRFEKMSVFEIITDLKAIFAPQARAERSKASKLFVSTKMEKHNSMS